MKSPLRVLMLEDSDADAELILDLLATEGISCDPLRVETQPDFIHAIGSESFDLVLSDFTLPSFDGFSALKIVHAQHPDVPFIFVSGTLGEELAIETLKNGATDYVLKHRLSRLAPAVRRAISEADERFARQEAEKSQSEANFLFRSLFDEVTVGVAIASPHGRIIKANPALETLLGYPTGGLNGAALSDLIHPVDAPREELFSTDKHQHELERRFVRCDGAVLWGRMVVSRIQCDSDPRTVHLIEDISERKEVLRRLVQAEKMEVVGRLAAGFAHDFNNFVTVINGFSQLLLKRTPADDPTRFELQQIHTAGDRAAALVQRMLLFSRQQVPKTTLLDLNALITTLDHALRSLIGDKVRLSLHLGCAPSFVEHDQIQIEQILMNLANNARDAMPDGGELTIATENVLLDEQVSAAYSLAVGDYVALTVTDTGHGMDATTRVKIFEPFFTTKEIGKGTGLGLWTVRETVRQSNGAIEVDSEWGRGSTFRILLPRFMDTASSIDNLSQHLTVSAASHRAVPSSPANVLIVDDDPAIRALLRHILLLLGYSVLEASNGRQALQHLRHVHVGLMITDLIMPDQEGLETIRKVRKEFPDLHVVAMSGGFGEQFLTVARKLGAAAVLHKPFEVEAVRELVCRLLQNAEPGIPASPSPAVAHR